MNKLIKLVDQEKGIMQVTTVDERWYCKDIMDVATGLPISHLFVPSSTWICGYYPKGMEYHRWLASKGWDKAEEIKNAAGDKGTKVHKALEAIFDGQTIDIDECLPDSEGNITPITMEEWECISSGVAWANARQPKSIRGEFVVFNEKDGYAGTVDRLFEIDGEIWIVDFKTSKNIWAEHKLQLSSYKHAMMETDPKAKDYKMMALQVGYKLNRAGYKENIIPDKYDKFLAVRQIWEEENPNEKPKQRDYPLELKYEPKKVEQAVNQSE